MVAQKQVWCWSRSWELHPNLQWGRVGGRVGSLGLVWAFETHKDTLPPTRPSNPSIPSKQFQKTCGDYSIQTTTKWKARSTGHFQKAPNLVSHLLHKVWLKSTSPNKQGYKSRALYLQHLIWLYRFAVKELKEWGTYIMRRPVKLGSKKSGCNTHCDKSRD